MALGPKMTERVRYAKERAGYGPDDTPCEPRRSAYTDDPAGSAAFENAVERHRVYSVLVLTPAQEDALSLRCARYGVEFRHSDYLPAFDLPDGYVAGWIGGNAHNGTGSAKATIYVGVSEDGEVSS